MAEERTLCRMQVVEAMDVLVRGVRVPLDPGIYDVGQSTEGLMSPEESASVEDPGWFMEILSHPHGILTDDEITEAERFGRIRWLT